MTGVNAGRGGPPCKGRDELAARLRDRASEIEQLTFERVRALGEPIADVDPAYTNGMRRALMEGLAFGIEGVEKGLDAPIPIPAEIIRQARRAARVGIRLETVLRRCAAGSKLLEEFILAEAACVPGRVLRQVLSEQGPQLDRLLESIGAEYREEVERSQGSPSDIQADRILEFLESGRTVCPVDLDYDLDAWHVGVILVGHREAGMRVLRVLAERWASRLLSVSRDPDAAWVWLGCRRKLDVAELARRLECEGLEETFVALGEARKGLDGWRQTLREAQVAQTELYRAQPVTRCRDVILVSAVVRDPVLAKSLIETYLTPLDDRSDRGEILRETLRAYFHSNQNAKTAAANLGVARHTVERRLRSVEERLGQTLCTCNAQLQVALGAEEAISLFGGRSPNRMN